MVKIMLKFRDEFSKIEKDSKQKDMTLKDKLLKSKEIENNLNEQIEDQKYKFDLLLREFNKLKENPGQQNEVTKQNENKIETIDLKFDLELNDNNEPYNNIPQYKSILYILKELNLDSKIFYRKSKKSIKFSRKIKFN